MAIRLSNTSSSVALSVFFVVVALSWGHLIRQVRAQDMGTVLEELEDAVEDVRVMGGGDPKLHRETKVDEFAVDPELPGSSGASETDHTATIVGCLLMFFIVGIGLAIAFVLNMYKKRMDGHDQLHVRLEV